MSHLKKYIEKYKTFLRYVMVAGFSFILDISLFAVFSKIILRTLSAKIFISTICARIISSVINFLLNKNYVFKSDANYLKSAVKYVTLVIVQMLVSATAVSLIVGYFEFEEVIVKFFVDVILFFINYFVQRIFIFKRSKN